MRLLPKKKVGKIQFCQVHLGPWGQHAEQLGISPDRLAELAAKTEAARVAYAAQYAAQQAARSATLKLNHAVAEMATVAACIISGIRTKAQVADDDGIYGLAHIPKPAKPSPIAPPGTPTDFIHALRPDGTLLLTWKCKNPRGAQGTQYNVYRRMGWTGPFEFCGAVGKRKFIDKTIPTGTATVMYQLQAVRTTGAGDWANHVVNFGVRGAQLATVRTARAA